MSPSCLKKKLNKYHWAFFSLSIKSKNFLFLKKSRFPGSDTIDGTSRRLLAHSGTSERSQFETLVNISIVHFRLRIKRYVHSDTRYERTRVGTDVTALTSSSLHM
jgi:hypothetical protein